MKRKNRVGMLRGFARMFAAVAIFVTLGTVAARAQAKKALTNADVIQMAKSGFDDATIEKAIQVNGGNFDLSAPALVDLKNGGVSQAVIDTMLSAPHASSASTGSPAASSSTASSASTSAAGAQAASTTSNGDANNPLSPHEQGVYLYEGSGTQAKLVRIASRSDGKLKTSGGFTSTMTIGMAKSKTRMIFSGEKATVRVASSNPVFYIYSDKPADYKLARFDVKDKERQLEISEQGRSSGAIAVPDQDLIPLAVQPVGAGISKVMPQNPLSPGEYCFYQGVPTTVLDFGVDMPAN